MGRFKVGRKMKDFRKNRRSQVWSPREESKSDVPTKSFIKEQRTYE